MLRRTTPADVRSEVDGCLPELVPEVDWPIRQVRWCDPCWFECPSWATGYGVGMARYEVNDVAVARARELIDGRQYVLDSDWGEVQPNASAGNAYLERHSWEEYSAWHLGLTVGATDETKARYGFVYGDFRRVHRTGLIACVYRAAEWRHKQIELAAHELLQLLDRAAGIE